MPQRCPVSSDLSEDRNRVGTYMTSLIGVSLSNSLSHFNYTTCCIEPFKDGEQKKNTERKGAILTVNFLRI